MLLLVPSDPLTPRHPDAHFADEAEAARELGWTVGLVDHDALERGRASEAVPRRLAGDLSGAVYRGWMLRAEQYAALETQLAGHGVQLRTSAAQYRAGHELPGWVRHLGSATPETAWTEGFDLDRFADCCARLGSGAAVLRDHVKSLKHAWAEAALVPDVADRDRATAVARRFVELRGEDATRGFVLRRFEDFTGAEARTWWVEGTHVLTTSHPDTPGELPTAAGLDDWVRHVLTPLVRSTALPLVTVDVTARADGAWRVVELGDGQVSDRPSSTPAGEFVRAVLGG